MTELPDIEPYIRHARLRTLLEQQQPGATTGLVNLPDGTLEWVGEYPVRADGRLILTPAQEAEIVRRSLANSGRCPDYRAAKIREAHEAEIAELRAEQVMSLLAAQMRPRSDGRGGVS